VVETFVEVLVEVCTAEENLVFAVVGVVLVVVGVVLTIVVVVLAVVVLVVLKVVCGRGDEEVEVVLETLNIVSALHVLLVETCSQNNFGV